MIRTLLPLLFAAAIVTAPPVLAQEPVVDDAAEFMSEDFDPKVMTLTGPANLRELADRAGYDGDPTADYLFVVPQGVNILGSPGGKGGRNDGGPALVSGSWPDGVEIWLFVRGHVYGGGGRGGNGGVIPVPTDGGRGGDAVVAQAPMTIVVLKTGSIKAGGGGGAGADGAPGLGGSGGGGGFPNGEPGQPGSPGPASGEFRSGDWGKPGTPGGGGRGGSRGIPGGRGGDTAMPGESANRVGGAPGNAVRLNGVEVTVLNGGQMYGEAY